MLKARNCVNLIAAVVTGLGFTPARDTGSLGDIYLIDSTVSWTERQECATGSEPPQFVCEFRFSKAPTYDWLGIQNGVKMTITHTVAKASWLSRFKFRYVDQGRETVLDDVTVADGALSATVSGTIPLSFEKWCLTRYDCQGVAEDITVQYGR